MLIDITTYDRSSHLGSRGTGQFGVNEYLDVDYYSNVYLKMPLKVINAIWTETIVGAVAHKRVFQTITRRDGRRAIICL